MYFEIDVHGSSTNYKHKQKHILLKVRKVLNASTLRNE